MNLLSLLISGLKGAEDAVARDTKSLKELKLAATVAENKIYLAANGDNQLSKVALLALEKDKDEKVSIYISCQMTESDAQKRVAFMRKCIEFYAIEACVPKKFCETAVAFYKPGDTTVEVCFTKGVQGKQTLCWFDLITDKPTNKHKA